MRRDVLRKGDSGVAATPATVFRVEGCGHFGKRTDADRLATLVASISLLLDENPWLPRERRRRTRTLRAYADEALALARGLSSPEADAGGQLVDLSDAEARAVADALRLSGSTAAQHAGTRIAASLPPAGDVDAA
jgi:hypothetical protein